MGTRRPRASYVVSLRANSSTPGGSIIVFDRIERVTHLEHNRPIESPKLTILWTTRQNREPSCFQSIRVQGLHKVMRNPSQGPAMRPYMSRFDAKAASALAVAPRGRLKRRPIAAPSTVMTIPDSWRFAGCVAAVTIMSFAASLWLQAGLPRAMNNATTALHDLTVSQDLLAEAIGGRKAAP